MCIRDSPWTIYISHVFPDRITCVLRIKTIQSIELIVSAAHDGVPYPVIQFGTPRFGTIGDDAIGIPCRQAHERAALKHITPIATEHHLVDDHMRDTTSYLLIKQRVITFVIDKDLGADYPCKATDVILSIGATESDICLLYTSDAADERSSVDLGGRRIIKKKK